MNYAPPAGAFLMPSVPDYFSAPSCSEDAVDTAYGAFLRRGADPSFEQWLCVHLWVALTSVSVQGDDVPGPLDPQSIG